MAHFQNLKKHFPSATFLAVGSVIVVGFGGIFIYLGIYNIGADAPHTEPVYWVVEKLREASIARHARNIVMPLDLNDPKRIASGAGLYTGMCSGCHLGPGVEKSEISQGLYPPAPDLGKEQSRSAEQQFWMIKHGIKLTSMPAWGRTHNDELIWNMVAFVRTLPKLTPAQYEAATKRSPKDHDATMKDTPGMKDMTMDRKEGVGADRK